MSFPAPPRKAAVTTMSVPPHTARSGPIPRAPSPRISALGPRPDAAVLTAFWDGVAETGAPLVENVSGGECTYTFVHRGCPDTRRVALLGNKLTDPQTLDDALFDHLPGTDVWWRSVRMGAGWRSSYAIAAQTGARPPRAPEVVTRIEQRRARSLAVSEAALHDRIHDWYDLMHHATADPFARESAPPGSPLPSVVSGPGAPAPLTLLPSSEPGRIVPVGDERRADLWWHVPAAPAPAEWDVLVLLDGERWLHRTTVLDAWQESGVLPPTVTLLVGSGPLEKRVADLTCSPELIADLVRVLDEASRTPGSLGAPPTRDPARTRIVGQSLGALTALYAQCVAPDRFGVSVCQSGSFWWPNAGPSGESEWLTHALERSGIRLDTVSIEVGTHEWVLLEPTRRLRDALADRCEQLSYQEFDGGHDEACWSVSLPHLLHDTTRPR